MKLIVGLGNPGSKYLLTRHNIGFMAIDNFAQGLGAPPGKVEFDSLTCKFKLDGEEVLLAKPQSFMNNSGEPVQQLMHFYKIEIQNLLVVHDDIDLEFGAVKFHKNRGSGGQNGVKSINERLGTMDYARLKLGVGRPKQPGMDVSSWVLKNFDESEQAELSDLLNYASDAIESFIFDGIELSTSRYNRKANRETSEQGS